ncbi:MAG: AAA family ATPase [Kiritimatiellae bacterium]|nr:AAA family ATPase [Kiritimatiellia bacterium]
MRMTETQQAALRTLAAFLRERSVRIAILRGYAGTGKTTLLAQLAQLAERDNRHVVLLAPTGRGARVLATATRRPAATIHAHIFSLTQLDTRRTSDDEPDTLHAAFRLRTNHDRAPTLYLVDEASMISDTFSSSETLCFGSGRLLADLLEYALFSSPGDGHQIVFAGDPAQLPPVDQSESPALEPAWFREHYGLQPLVVELTDIVRQAAEHPLLELATALRDGLRSECFCDLRIADAPPGLQRIGAFDPAGWAAHLRERGMASAVVITDSNARALRYNRAIRAELHGTPSAPPQPGDRLIIAANSHYNELPLLNGDLVEIVAADREVEIVQQPLAARDRDSGRRVIPLMFRRVVIRPPSASPTTKLELRILENTLDSEERDISRLEHQALYVHFRQRYRSLDPRSPDFISTLFRDPWFTALRVKYAYALTAHKAQGGEWPRVLVDMATVWHPATATWFRWAYTAVTRAREELQLLNAPTLSPDLRAEPAAAGIVRVCDAIHPTLRPADAALPPEWLGSTAFLRAATLEILHALREAGFEATGVAHYPWLIRFELVHDRRPISANVHYNGQQRLTTLVTPPQADQTLADALRTAIAPLLGRPFVLDHLALPVPSPELPPHSPLPETCPHPGMRRFDQLHRAALTGQPLSITAIEVLGRHQLRYTYRDASGAQAVINYYFNRAGACTSHSVDARRTTAAELAGRILALRRPLREAPQ